MLDVSFGCPSGPDRTEEAEVAEASCFSRLTPRGRERIVRQIKSPQPPQAVGLAAGVVDVHAEVKFQLR
jgi:hypothetical protein